MKLLKIIDNIPHNYSLEKFLEEYPEEKVFKRSDSLPSPHVLKQFDVYIPVEHDKPLGDYVFLGQKEPVFENGEWHIYWDYREMTEEEKIEIINIKKQRENLKSELTEITNNGGRIDDHEVYKQ